MSEDLTRPTSSDLPDPPTLSTMAERAGQIRSPEPDEIDRFRHTCLAFIATQGDSHAAAMAKSKAEEMIFWVRAARNARS